MRTTHTRTQRVPQPRKRLPSPTNSANAVAVSDGCYCAGWVIEHDRAHLAFTPDGELLGSFKTRAAAVAALPYADLLGIDEFGGARLS
jgi:hypothetical protein